MCKGATDYAYAVSWMCIVWCPVIADRSDRSALSHAIFGGSLSHYLAAVPR